jgi:hypothetical protein
MLLLLDGRHGNFHREFELANGARTDFTTRSELIPGLFSS